MTLSVINALSRGIGSLIRNHGARARLSILIYHRVVGTPDPLFPEEIDSATFACHMDALGECFNVLPLSEALDRLSKRSLPLNAASITFDDGYRNNYEVAAPILRERSLSACFFVASGFLDGSCMWNDTIIECIRSTNRPRIDLTPIGLTSFDVDNTQNRRIAIETVLPYVKRLTPELKRRAIDLILEESLVTLPRGLMMSPDQVRDLAASEMEIGCHTISHPILSNLSASAAREEIGGCKEDLESIVGQKISLFAYPNGRPSVDFTDRDIEIVKEVGFSAATTTAKGTARTSTDRYLLPRFTPWDRKATYFKLRLLHNFLLEPGSSN